MSNELRIVSFLPAATEMVCALGLGDRLVGISHECDYPPEVRAKPVVVRPALELEKMSLHEIDVAVSARLRTGASLYQIDEQRLRELAPTLILTQNLCQVCAPSGNEVSQVLKAMSPPPEILWLTPRSLEGVNDNLRELGRATGRADAAEALIASGRERLGKIPALTRRAAVRPRVFCLEWVDPLYCSGHWISEMVELAGGEDALSRRGTDSVRIAWADVVQWAPEVLVVMPCGFSLRKAVEQVKQLGSHPGWSDLPAVRNGRVFAVNANAYFARPGPRLVDGTELLAHLFHPDLAAWSGSDDAFERMDFSEHSRVS
jgi:iron complex transport system substrate-binding protein